MTAPASIAPTVTQADRDAAYAYWLFTRSLPSTCYRAVEAKERFDNGSKDNSEIVQAFVRHREAGQAELLKMLEDVAEGHALHSDILDLLERVKGGAE